MPRERTTLNAYEGRWKWWYSAIADWMIANPDGKLADCATALNKSRATISLIIQTDLFKDYLSRRKEQWRQRHDFALVQKTTRVAEAALDSLLSNLEKKKDQVPINLLNDIASTALDRLGYSPQKQSPASVQVNVQQNAGPQIVHAAISPEALEEAREALRVAERNRAERAQNLLEATPVPDSEKEDEGDSATPLD